MKLHYYPETDSLYIELKPGPGAETREVCDGLNVDLDTAGGVVGFDIDHASQRLDLTTLETEALPLRSTGGLIGSPARLYPVRRCGERTMKLKVVVHEAEEGGYWAEVPAIPGCATQGDSFEELLGNLYEAIEGCLSVDVR